jgi:SpoVK/Ycf46/Vps4 family AAA+-type ATPase
VLDEWGFGRRVALGRGLTALFSGPPGTGKTMAAQVLARELGLDLYRVDLSRVMSKWIGETEKHLARLFDEAQASGAVLFFDEADALFGKRSEVKDAHDRYANVEIGYLLQRMEGYEGVTLLATNRKADLDEAFVRRFHFLLNFPPPDAAMRRRIWEGMFPAAAERDPSLDLARLARDFEVTGGEIKNVALAAAFLAAGEDRPIGMPHLARALARELRKEGKLVDERRIHAP